jgi:hypothetical protein
VAGGRLVVSRGLIVGGRLAVVAGGALLVGRGLIVGGRLAVVEGGSWPTGPGGSSPTEDGENAGDGRVAAVNSWLSNPSFSDRPRLSETLSAVTSCQPLAETHAELWLDLTSILPVPIIGRISRTPRAVKSRSSAV